jgi:glucokinase
MREGDASAFIFTHAESEGDKLSCRTMEIFLTTFGSEVGNLAVCTMALGGSIWAEALLPNFRPARAWRVHALNRSRSLPQPKVVILGS